ncbi:TraR/DksA family transcriptional regulator [Galbibacter orientalis]|uniref:TraR/DksA family transcriptional regulator n=1 Tax=Galbibacter orientalis TaxID=453852 RepID=UPI00307FCFFB
MTDKTDFTENVFKEIHKLEGKVTLYRSLTAPISPDNAIGRVSRMDAINNKSVMEASLRETEKRIAKLHQLLDRINDTDFGICIRCKKPIPEKRLMIIPETKFCIECSKMET